MKASFEPPYQLEIVSEETIGRGGFLFIRRLRLHNLRPDGTRSREWLCDFVERPKGVDAVVLVLWRRAAPGVQVLLRRGLRPAVHLGRPAERVPLPDGRTHGFVIELVAGIIEEGEVGEAAIRRRAIEEAWEEAGVRLGPEAVELLGPGMFPSPGMTAEKFWFAAAEVPADATGHPPAGDGSPMEEGAEVRWVELDEALGLCEAGVIEDAKTELGLLRLARRLGRTPGLGQASSPPRP
ncbi:MAG TPA: NUDIX domain-containing protein [Polyangia bacterium]|jgi:ADP-ribose pyrophosphatase|nr:NUDIX domain-containing protein [Polyangia bacterium]